MITYTVKRGMVFLSALFLLNLSSCEKSPTESAPESATISGMVSFAGDWPSAGSVYISIQNSWPPTGAPYAVESVTSSTSSHDYTFEDVAFGTYGAITVSWKDPDDPNPGTNQHILGAYGGTVQAGFMDASSITVSEEEHELKGIDIPADFNLATP